MANGTNVWDTTRPEAETAKSLLNKYMFRRGLPLPTYQTKPGASGEWCCRTRFDLPPTGVTIKCEATAGSERAAAKKCAEKAVSELERRKLLDIEGATKATHRKALQRATEDGPVYDTQPRATSLPAALGSSPSTRVVSRLRPSNLQQETQDQDESRSVVVYERQPDTSQTSAQDPTKHNTSEFGGVLNSLPRSLMGVMPSSNSQPNTFSRSASAPTVVQQSNTIHAPVHIVVNSVNSSSSTSTTSSQQTLTPSPSTSTTGSQQTLTPHGTSWRKSVPDELRYLFQCQDRLNDADLLSVSKQIGKFRKTIGLTLGLTYADIENCKFREEDPYEVNRKVLRTWRELHSSRATLGRLCKVLWKTGAKDAVWSLNR